MAGHPITESWPGARDAVVDQDPGLPQAQLDAQHAEVVACLRDALIALEEPSLSDTWRASVRIRIRRALEMEGRQ